MWVILHMPVITQMGWSALMWAAREGKTEAVVELVKAGTNLDMQDNVCQYSYMTHDVNVQSHTGRLNSPDTCTCTCNYTWYMYIVHCIHIYMYL